MLSSIGTLRISLVSYRVLIVNIPGKDFFFSSIILTVRSLELSSTTTMNSGGMLCPIMESRVVPRVSAPSLVMMQHHHEEEADNVSICGYEFASSLLKQKDTTLFYLMGDA